jgi:hypothetical protein
VKIGDIGQDQGTRGESEVGRRKERGRRGRGAILKNEMAVGIEMATGMGVATEGTRRGVGAGINTGHGEVE